MSEITKEQWAKITEELKGSIPLVEFEYKGRKLTIHRQRYSESESKLTVYVDGLICGAWMDANSKEFDPVVAEVWFQKSSSVYKRKEKEKLIKTFGKRKALEYFPQLNRKLVLYSPVFGAARTLVNQYKKIKGLELLTIGYGNRAVMSSAQGITVYEGNTDPEDATQEAKP